MRMPPEGQIASGGRQCPLPREYQSTGRIVEILQIGGLHHGYERLSACSDTAGCGYGE